MANEETNMNTEQTGTVTGDPGNSTQETMAQNQPEAQGENAEKMFTQDDVNQMIQKRLKAEQKKMPSKEELDAFNEWKKAQEPKKTSAEEAQEIRQKLEEANAELERYKNKEKVLKAGVDGPFADFATFQVSQLVNDETDFDSALTSWIASNEQFTKKVNSEQPTPNVATGMRQGNAATKISGVEAEFYKRNPNLKPKD